MKVKHKDARILREALARIHSQFPHPMLQKYIESRLREYATQVQDYCDHHDKGLIEEKDGKLLMGCLDCGMRSIQPKPKK